jgi:hypothetical protein
MVRLRGVTANRLRHASSSLCRCWSGGSAIGHAFAIAMPPSAHCLRRPQAALHRPSLLR